MCTLHSNWFVQLPQWMVLDFFSSWSKWIFQNLYANKDDKSLKLKKNVALNWPVLFLLLCFYPFRLLDNSLLPTCHRDMIIVQKTSLTHPGKWKHRNNRRHLFMKFCRKKTARTNLTRNSVYILYHWQLNMTSQNRTVHEPLHVCPESCGFATAELAPIFSTKTSIRHEQFCTNRILFTNEYSILQCWMVLYEYIDVCLKYLCIKLL